MRPTLLVPPPPLVPPQRHQGLVQPLPPQAPVRQSPQHGDLRQQGAEVRGAGGQESPGCLLGVGRGPSQEGDGQPPPPHSPLTRLHEDWESFIHDLHAHLERVYFPDTVEEWMEENVNPYLDQLRDLVQDYRAIIRLKARPKVMQGAQPPHLPLLP